MWYKPEPSDDLVSWVLLILAILFPTQFAKFPAYRLQVPESREEVEGLLRFQGELESSSVWGALWRDATNVNVEGLRQIKDLGLSPTRGGITASEWDPSANVSQKA